MKKLLGLLSMGVLLFSCSEKESNLVIGDCNNCVLLKYGEEETLIENLKIKIESIGDYRCSGCETCNSTYSFFINAKVSNGQQDTTLVLPGNMFCDEQYAISVESLFKDFINKREVFGYQLAIYDVMPVKKSFKETFTPQDYVITMAVRKQ